MTETSLECGGCRAVLTFPGAERAQVCPYCASPNVVLATAGEVHPHFCLPHRHAEGIARRALGDWQRQLNLFRHPGVKTAKLEAFRGMYVPAYLYSAVARAHYEAEIGEEYYVTVTTNGKTRREKRHEWRHLTGEYDSSIADIIVSASAGIPNVELEAIEPFDLRALRRYQPALVSGWSVEAPTSSETACRQLARQELEATLRHRLAAFMPGDKHRDLTFVHNVEREAVDLLLVPVWVLALAYDPKKPPLRVLINGQTGKVSAQVPWSWQRIVIAVVLALLVVGGLVVFGKVHQ